MIQSIKTLLKQSGAEWWLKSHALYELYLRVFYSSYINTRNREIKFYQSITGSKGINLIFDIGANGGDKADRFLRMGAKVICVEPDKYCCDILKKRFRSNLNRLTIVNKAVSDSVETRTFYILKEGSAYNTLSEKWATEVSQRGQELDISEAQKHEVQTTTIDDLILINGLPELIKIDIEGYEINALMGLNSKVSSITFELNLPEFRQESIECIDKLNSIDPDSSFNYFIDCTNGLELTQNIGAKEFKDFLLETKLKYLEVLCQINYTQKD